MKLKKKHYVAFLVDHTRCMNVVADTEEKKKSTSSAGFLSSNNYLYIAHNPPKKAKQLIFFISTSLFQSILVCFLKINERD